MKQNLRWTLATLLIALAIFVVIGLLFQTARVEGSSMEKSFYNGQYLVVNKVLYHFRSPDRGDVIIFHPPPSTDSVYIKRIIGLPSDHVSIVSINDGGDGRVYINGKLLEEPDCIPPVRTYSKEWNTVPQDCYLVLGDNRNSSDDSHVWGFVPSDSIIGEVWLCYWPPGEWGISPDYAYSMAA